MTGIRKGYFSCQEWNSISGRGVRDWTLGGASPYKALLRKITISLSPAKYIDTH